MSIEEQLHQVIQAMNGLNATVVNLQQQITANANTSASDASHQTQLIHDRMRRIATETEQRINRIEAAVARIKRGQG